MRSLRAGRYKFIDAPRPELFDLSRDPFEESNIYGTRRDLAAVMQARVAAIAASPMPILNPDRPAVAWREGLAALGYVVADRRRPVKGQSGLPDPKDMIHLLNPDMRR